MMPLGDDNSQSKSPPVITYALILVNVLVFFIELGGGDAFVEKWSFVPSRFLGEPVVDFPTLFTSMFMHGGWMHLGGNMLYLWIFGDNVEDNFGKIPYLVFYLLCGVAATFSQLAFNAASTIPNLGASGAIAGVLGAYIIMFPNERIRVLIGNAVTVMPALLVIGVWFLLQFLSSVDSLQSTQDVGGVAYLAHVGGFVAGVGLTFLFRTKLGE